MTERLPLEAQTLYAELMEHLLAADVGQILGRLPGTFVVKRIKGAPYVYLQVSMPGGSTRQIYVGAQSRVLDRTIERFEGARRDAAPDLQREVRLATQLRISGVNTIDPPSARVVRGLAAAGLFQAGGVLVGTHAFVALGNLLGVRWTGVGLRTQDVDIATSAERDIDVAVPDLQTDVPSVLESLKMGFLPIPSLNPKQPSTSFKVRGQSLRVDLLCPGRGEDDPPVLIGRFRASAQPLRFLDYLLESPDKAVVLNGGVTLVNVPRPARFALHKLIVAAVRPAAWQTKVEKDLAQAIALLEILIEDRPGDVTLAWTDLAKRGPSWRKPFLAGLRAAKTRSPTLHDGLLALLPNATR